MPRAVDGETQAALDKLQEGIDNDPDIQRLLAQNKDRLAATRDQGGDARRFQNQLRDQIVQIAESKGYIPEKGQYFINPNDGQLEPHGGWSGLSNKTRAAIIAAAAVATWGATGFAGAGALGIGGGGSAVTSAAGGGVPSGLGDGGLTATQAYGAAAPVVAGSAAPAAATAGGGGGIGGFFRNAANFLRGNAGRVIGAAGSAIGGAANAATNNRGVQLEADIERARLDQQAERDFFNQTLDREEEGRAKQKNAWEMMNRGASMRDAPDNLNRTMLSPYSRALAGPSEGQRAGATGMFDQMSQQLAEGNTLERPRRVGTDVRVQPPGGFERMAGWLSPGLTAWDRINQER